MDDEDLECEKPGAEIGAAGIRAHPPVSMTLKR
jgi:hypothetical protein